MGIEYGVEYYVVSRDYEGLDLMSLVMTGDDDNGLDFGVYCYRPDHDGRWLWAGYIKETDLLSADEILKLWENHQVMQDAFARHG